MKMNTVPRDSFLKKPKAIIVVLTCFMLVSSLYVVFSAGQVNSQARFETYNVKDYGAVGNGVANDTAAARAALDAAILAGGGTIYFPAGTYNLAPTEEGKYVFYIHGSNLTFLGDGPDETILSFYAWDMQDPEDLILKRGGGFTTLNAPGAITNITFRELRATGNASPTENAGQWWGDDSLDGWDITHKGLGIWGTVDNVLIENTEWDNWRGEVIYAGGGLELGTFTIRNTVVHDSNASAVSMTGKVIIEDSEIYNVYNGTENFSLGARHGNEIRRTTIEPNRDLPFEIGRYAIVYIGHTESYLVVEDSTLKNSASAGIFLSEFAHDVTIQDNTFIDTQIGIYAIHLNQYPQFSDQRGYTDFLVDGNEFRAVNESMGEAITFYTAPGRDWIFSNNTTTGTGDFKVNNFFRIQGARGVFTVSGNTFNDTNPGSMGDGPRPSVWTNNTITGAHEFGASYNNYEPDLSIPWEITPSWPKIKINDLRDGTDGKIIQIPEEDLDLFPTGFSLEFRNMGGRSGTEGIEIKPDSNWNTLTRGYMVHTGAFLNLEMGESGKFDFVSYTPRTGTPITITQSQPSYARDLQEISFYGFDEVTLAPTVPHTFNTFGGVPENVTVTINYNDKVTIEHVPDHLEVPGNTNFVAEGSGSISAIKEDGVLRLVMDPVNSAPIANSQSVQTTQNAAVRITLGASDADNDSLTYTIVTEPSHGELNGTAPNLTYRPNNRYSGSDSFTFKVNDGTVDSNTVTVTITILDRSAPAFSSLSIETSTTTAIVTWDTDEVASTKIEYGLVSSLGFATSEANISNRVSDHVVELSNLTPCSTYRYRAVSRDADENISSSSVGTFTTKGCPGNAQILDEGSYEIERESGGSFSLLTSGRGLSVTFPAGYLAPNQSRAYVQGKRLDRNAYLTSVVPPAGQTLAARHLYRITPFASPTTTVSGFIKPITVTVSYQDADITGIDEDTLTLRRYNGESWNTLSNCVRNTAGNTISCTTTEFSEVALMGEESSTDEGSGSGGGSSGGGGGGGSSSSNTTSMDIAMTEIERDALLRSLLLQLIALYQHLLLLLRSGI